MRLLPLISLVVHTLGFLAFGGILVLSIREALRPGSSGPARLRHHACRPVSLVGGTLVFLVMCWYGAGVMTLLSPPLGLDRSLFPLIALAMAQLFPPMIMHVTYSETLSRAGRRPGRGWGAVVAAGYVISSAVIVLSIVGLQGGLGIRPTTVGIGSVTALCLLFISAGIYNGLALARSRREAPETIEERSSRRWHAGLYVFLSLLFVPILLSMSSRSSVMEVFDRVLVPMIPMGFLLVGTYFEDRFEFFDLLVKRGLFVLVTMVLLVAHVGVVLPALDRVELGWARPWAQGVALLPLGLALPFLYRAGAQLVDRRWLGRSFSTVAAMKHFLSTVQPATTETELLARTEAGLSQIFRAPVRADLGTVHSGFEAILEVPIRSDGVHVGTLRLGRRADAIPFFSEDLALLDSLAGVFAYLLENVRLQEKKKEQEQRTRELSLHASRSELKALRAQVNPHFLFNALNAIAGLIHRDPAQADRTVEQLAEVFRYTLRRSETEWARLADELDFVRAYLEVERARFGERFTFRIACGDDLAEVRLPAMIIQTLVENAIKHGVAAVRGPGRVEVQAQAGGGQLRISVADNGPGFRRRAPAPGSGYGLQNVEHRLRGHYGDAAALRLARQDGRTVVSIEMPLAPPDASAGASDRAADVSRGAV